MPLQQELRPNPKNTVGDMKKDENVSKVQDNESDGLNLKMA